jgi:TonB family protein
VRTFVLLPILSVIFGLVIVPAGAQDSSTPRANTITVQTPFVYQRPTLVDKPQPCDSVIRPNMQELMKSGPVTTLEFEITAEGDVKDVRITEPSGRADYDQSWADCIMTWRYHPALHNGVSIDVRWGLRISWLPSLVLFDDPGQIAAPTYAAIQSALLQCAKSPRPTPEQLAKANMPSRLRLNTFGGRIASMELVSSSGVSELDARAMHCLEVSSAAPVSASSAARQFPFSIYWDQYASW